MYTRFKDAYLIKYWSYLVFLSKIYITSLILELNREMNSFNLVTFHSMRFDHKSTLILTQKNNKIKNMGLFEQGPRPKPGQGCRL